MTLLPGRWKRWTVTVAAAAVVTGTTLVTAAPAGADTTLAVEAGYAGSFIPGRPLPVRARVAADRLLATLLEVTVDDGTRTAVPIEVPGGSEKEFLVVVPTSISQQAPVTATVRLADGSRSPPRGSAGARPVVDEELVGLLPGVLGGRPVPGAAPLSVDVGTARFAALDAADLDRAPDSLGPLGTLGAGTDELGRLPAGTRNGILAWVEGGGRLLVDAPAGSPVPGLPDAWQPGASGRALAGQGEIRLTGGAMAAGRWSGLVEPTPRSAVATAGVETFGGPPLGDSLARAAGFRLPRISWLVGFLVLYVAMIGPVLFVVLRRRGRPELSWVAIPLIALVFTAAGWAGGRTLRTDTEMVHGTVLTTGTTGVRATTYLGLVSRTGGTLHVSLPPGWLTGEAGPGGASRLESVTLNPSGPEGRLPLDAGQFALASATGPAEVTGALEVTAVAEANGQASGTVRNGTPFALDGAAVFISNGAASVGPLAPGEQQEWQAEIQDGSGPPLEFQLWARTGFRGELADRSALLSLWDLAQRSGAITRSPGNAIAAGWTRDFVPPVRIGGRTSSPTGDTLVLGSARVGAADAATTLSVRREVVRAPNRAGRELEARPDTFRSVVRFSLPPGRADPARVSLRTAFGPAEVWTGEGWTALECTPPTCQPRAAGSVTTVPGVAEAIACAPGAPCILPPVPVGPGGRFGGPEVTELAVPASAVRDGLVYVRLPAGASSGPFGEPLPSLREVT